MPLSTLVIFHPKGTAFMSTLVWEMVCFGLSGLQSFQVYQHHYPDFLRTRRRVQYKDMWDYVGGARRLPGPCQFSHNVF